MVFCQSAIVNALKKGTALMFCPIVVVNAVAKMEGIRSYNR